jgi:uncharacterized membrane protein (UPF0127 family)
VDESKLIVNLTRGTVTCEDTVVADKALRRMRGLLGRSSLNPGHGMLLQPENMIHTAFMRFPIDVVLLDRNLHVLKIVEQLKPWRTASAKRARSVLELPAGEVKRTGVAVGDQLALIDPAMLDGTLAAASREVRSNGRDEWSAAAHDSGPTSPDGAAVLLISSDRRFRAVAAVLLAQRGYSVALGERLTETAQLARQTDARVVLLDTGGALTAAAREAAALEQLDSSVRVVMVAEQPEQQLSTMPVLGKWDFEGLYGSIAHAEAG